jgi:hypothetical protein
MAGKGSAPRKNANQKLYEKNWKRIFGNKKKSSNKRGKVNG